MSAAIRGFSLPATTIFKLSAQRPVQVSGGTQRGQETVLAAVQNPPRASQARPLADLLPEVLAAYGLGTTDAETANRLDAVA
jgi:hypothetical protein